MPKLFIHDESKKKGRSFDLDKKTLFIGRSTTNDIQIKDLTVSRKHLKIYTGGEMNIFFIEDLRSTNGTFIGDDLIEPGEAFQVDERDTITIGNTVMHLQGILASSPLGEKDTKIHHPKMHIDEKERLPLKSDRRSPSLKEQEFISKTSELLKKTVNINEILENALNYLFNVLPRINKAAIVLFDNQKAQLKQVIARSREGQGNGAARFSKALLKQVARDGKAIKLSNVIYESPAANSDKEQKSQTRSVLCVPIIRNSKIRGGIYVDSNLGQHDGFRKEDHLLLHRLSNLVGSTIEKASLLLN
jgi:pSer/pThr/pTyr-binding forkhead associated (FHA) protein